MAAASKMTPVEIGLRARIQSLELTLGITQNSNIGVIFRLPASLTKLLGLLLSAPNVTPEMVAELGIVTNTKVAMHRLRNYLDIWSKANGQEDFDIRSRRTLGYWLDESTKKRIRGLVTSEVTVEQSIDEDLMEIDEATAPAV